MISCACASEICAVMGCQRVRQIREQFVSAQQVNSPALDPHGIQAISDEIRRIVREEIERSRATTPNPQETSFGGPGCRLESRA